MALHWVIWSLLANGAITATEYLNHTGDSARGWWAVLPITAPLILLAQYSLFRSFNGAETLLMAWLVFTVGNSLMRVLMVSGFLGGQVSSWPMVLGGIVCMISGSYIVKSGLS